MTAPARLTELLRQRLSANDFATASALISEALCLPARIERVIVDPTTKRSAHGSYDA